VKYVFLIVITASDIAKSIQGEKRQCDVRKNYQQKKIILFSFSFLYLLPVPDLLPDAMGWGGVAKCDRQQQRALNLLINLQIISFYTIYYSTILQ